MNVKTIVCLVSTLLLWSFTASAAEPLRVFIRAGVKTHNGSTADAVKLHKRRVETRQTMVFTFISSL